MSTQVCRRLFNRGGGPSALRTPSSRSETQTRNATSEPPALRPVAGGWMIDRTYPRVLSHFRYFPPNLEAINQRRLNLTSLHNSDCLKVLDILKVSDEVVGKVRE